MQFQKINKCRIIHKCKLCKTIVEKGESYFKAIDNNHIRRTYQSEDICPECYERVNSTIYPNMQMSIFIRNFKCNWQLVGIDEQLRTMSVSCDVCSNYTFLGGYYEFLFKKADGEELTKNVCSHCVPDIHACFNKHKGKNIHLQHFKNTLLENKPKRITANVDKSYTAFGLGTIRCMECNAKIWREYNVHELHTKGGQSVTIHTCTDCVDYSIPHGLVEIDRLYKEDAAKFKVYSIEGFRANGLFKCDNCGNKFEEHGYDYTLSKPGEMTPHKLTICTGCHCIDLDSGDTVYLKNKPDEFRVSSISHHSVVGGGEGCDICSDAIESSYTSIMSVNDTLTKITSVCDKCNSAMDDFNIGDVIDLDNLAKYIVRCPTLWMAKRKEKTMPVIEGFFFNKLNSNNHGCECCNRRATVHVTNDKTYYNLCDKCIPFMVEYLKDGGEFDGDVISPIEAMNGRSHPHSKEASSNLDLTCEVCSVNIIPKDNIYNKLYHIPHHGSGITKACHECIITMESMEIGIGESFDSISKRKETMPAFKDGREHLTDLLAPGALHRVKQHGFCERDGICNLCYARLPENHHKIDIKTIDGIYKYDKIIHLCKECQPQFTHLRGGDILNPLNFKLKRKSNNMTFTNKLKKAILDNLGLISTFALGATSKKVDVPHIKFLGIPGTYGMIAKLAAENMDASEYQRALEDVADKLLAVAAFQLGEKVMTDEVILEKLFAGFDKLICAGDQQDVKVDSAKE